MGRSTSDWDLLGRNLRGERIGPREPPAWTMLGGRPECYISWHSAMFCSQALGAIHTELQWDDSATLSEMTIKPGMHLLKWQWRKRNGSFEGKRKITLSEFYVTASICAKSEWKVNQSSRYFLSTNMTISRNIWTVNGKACVLPHMWHIWENSIQVQA